MGWWSAPLKGAAPGREGLRSEDPAYPARQRTQLAVGICPIDSGPKQTGGRMILLASAGNRVNLRTLSSLQQVEATGWMLKHPGASTHSDVI